MHVNILGYVTLFNMSSSEQLFLSVVLNRLLEPSLLHEIQLVLLHLAKHATLLLNVKEPSHIKHLVEKSLSFLCFFLY